MQLIYKTMNKYQDHCTSVLPNIEVTYLQNTAIHLAAKNGHSRLIAMMLDSGAKIMDNSDEQNVLDVALNASVASSGVLLTLTEHERFVFELIVVLLARFLLA